MQPLSYASSNSKSPKPPLYSTTWVLVIPQTLGRHYKLASIPNAFDSVGTTDEERETHPQGRKISTTSSKVCNLLYTLQCPKKWFAERDKHYPSRSGQTSLATAGANFTKPRTSQFFGLCKLHNHTCFNYLQGGYSRQNSIDEVDANTDARKQNGNPAAAANTSPLIVPAVR